jgi:hypothetical protein
MPKSLSEKTLLKRGMFLMRTFTLLEAKKKLEAEGFPLREAFTPVF